MLTKGRIAMERLPELSGAVSPAELGCAARSGGSKRTCRSQMKYPSAIKSATMMIRSSLRPVGRVTEAERSMSFSRFTPSGVSLYTQATSSATGEPSSSTLTRMRSAQSGAPNAGDTTSATCTSSQATTA